MGKDQRPPLNLSLTTFGGTQACHVLVEKLNEAGDHNFARSVVRRITDYFGHCGELLKTDNPTRGKAVMQLFSEAMADAEQILKPGFEKYGIPFSYFHNVMTHKQRQTLEHGMLLEKLRTDDLSHNEILLHLRALAKAQANK